MYGGTTILGGEHPSLGVIRISDEVENAAFLQRLYPLRWAAAELVQFHPGLDGAAEDDF